MVQDEVLLHLYMHGSTLTPISIPCCTLKGCLYDRIFIFIPFALAYLAKTFRYTGFENLCVVALLYGMCLPLVLLDLAVSLYHVTVFPFLGIKRIPRKQYIRIDRHRLAYLPWVLKLGCAYCGYANGLLHYSLRIAGDTELYF